MLPAAFVGGGIPRPQARSPVEWTSMKGNPRAKSLESPEEWMSLKGNCSGAGLRTVCVKERRRSSALLEDCDFPRGDSMDHADPEAEAAVPGRGAGAVAHSAPMGVISKHSPAAQAEQAPPPGAHAEGGKSGRSGADVMPPPDGQELNSCTLPKSLSLALQAFNSISRSPIISRTVPVEDALPTARCGSGRLGQGGHDSPTSMPTPSRDWGETASRWGGFTPMVQQSFRQGSSLDTSPIPMPAASIHQSPALLPCSFGGRGKSFDEAAEESMRVAFKPGALIPVMAGRLSWLCANDEEQLQVARQQHPGCTFLTSFLHERYTPFCDDFGPCDVATVKRFVGFIKSKMQASPEEHLVYHTTVQQSLVTNAVFLLGAYLITEHGFSSEQALAPFLCLHPTPFRAFRDATNAPVNFELTLRDTLEGFGKAVEDGWLDFGELRCDEYEYWAHPWSGDLHSVSGKFVALSSPTDAESAASHRQPSSHLREFKKLGVTAVVRLDGERTYQAAAFEGAGFNHYELPFDDEEVCALPEDELVERFLDIVDQEEGAVAVTCRDGLGKGPTMIALYFMRHGGFSARQAIAFLRIVRPGSIIGPQQQFLHYCEGRTWEGNRMGPGGDRESWNEACCLLAMGSALTQQVNTALVHRARSRQNSFKSKEPHEDPPHRRAPVGGGGGKISRLVSTPVTPTQTKTSPGGLRRLAARREREGNRGSSSSIGSIGSSDGAPGPAPDGGDGFGRLRTEKAQTFDGIVQPRGGGGADRVLERKAESFEEDSAGAREQLPAGCTSPGAIARFLGVQSISEEAVRWRGGGLWRKSAR